MSGKPTTDQPLTGSQWLLLITAEAGRRRCTTRALVEQLSPNPSNFMQQLRRAKRPKPHTIERINALLRGTDVPPPPPRDMRQKAAPAPPVRTMSLGRDRDPIPDGPRVYRDPCFRCGTRGDIGCAHQRSF